MSTKEKILEMLESRPGEYISGETMAQQLSVSRAAVWKAVVALKADGCKISSSTNRGYALSKGSGTVSEHGIRAHLSDKYQASVQVRYLPSTDSTNNEAKRICAGGFSSNMLICAGEQTSGRGRMGRSFYSPGQTGVYMSLLISPKADFSSTVSITTAAAVCVVKAIEKLTGKSPQIKWVNDIYLYGKKVCGILSEAVTDFETGRISNIIVGIGINVSTTDFPDGLGDTAASLECGEINKNRLIAEITNGLLDYCEDFDFRKLLPFYKKHCFILGREVIYTKGTRSCCATAVDISENGALIVQDSQGRLITLDSGEITVRMK